MTVAASEPKAEEGAGAERRAPAALARGYWHRLRGSPAVRSVLYAFVLTRVVVLFVLIVGGYVSLIVGGGGAGETRDIRVHLEKVPVTRALRETTLKADVNWYLHISLEGYERKPYDANTYHTWAYFPLFPLLWHAASVLTRETVVTGVALSNLLFLAALFAVYGTARASGLDEWAADRAVFYLAAFPSSYFFSLPLTESLFLALAAGCLYAGRRRLWWLAGCLGALASATRFVGVLLLPVLLLLHFQTYGRGSLRRASVLWAALVPAGLLAYMLYLHLITGNAFAFWGAVAAWGRTPSFFLFTLFRYFADPGLIVVPWGFRLLNFLAPALALAAGAVLLRRGEWALGAFTFLLVAVALSSYHQLHSQARYAMTAFPAFFVLAQAARTRPRLDQTVGALSFALLTLLTALFVARFSMTMA